MGLNFSAQLDNRMRDYLRGRADGLLNDMLPHCRRQYAAAFLTKVWNELEPQASQGTQLLQSKEPKDTDQVISSGYIMQYMENKKKWKERYFVMKASYNLDCFESKEAHQRGLKPDGSVHLSGYISLSSASDYREMLHQSWPIFNVLFGRDSFEVRAFLEAVRVYREQKGRYGICDLYLGSETEILSNLVMEDLCPVLESQLIPHIRGAESKRKQTWLKLLGEMYAVVETQVSAEFRALLGENEEQRQRLERTIRPDFNQILAAKKQLMEKIQASLGERVRCFCREQVRPQLGPVQDAVAGSMGAVLGETRRLFSEEVSEVINKVKSGGDTSSLAQVCSQLQVLPHHSVQMHHCYKKTEELERYLSKVGPQFTFCGSRFLIQRAQNIVQQLMEDAVYTFQHMVASMQPSIGHPAETSQLLDNTRVLVLKKFGSDSNAAGRQFVQDALLELFLPFVLKTLEPVCKPELPAYEAYLSADDEGVIQIESTYKELVLHIVSEEINKAMKENSTRPKFSLYNESMAYLWDNGPQLSIAESTHSTSPTELPGQSAALGTIKEHKDHTESTQASGNNMMADGL
ncbi:protein Niban 1-like isoform X2 [Pristis pectinata]|uniref:protein Niban 1-like isoform X2 n=1 Tax=Pristis pectinata TaxID=685728 RepID=UPI00223D3833|nr:protein Niban 1-like isoform X2 [Pristis pectinata]